VVILAYFYRFGMLYLEKSGNPGHPDVEPRDYECASCSDYRLLDGLNFLYLRIGAKVYVGIIGKTHRLDVNIFVMLRFFLHKNTFTNT
jgi:hypothetical protein